MVKENLCSVAKLAKGYAASLLTQTLILHFEGKAVTRRQRRCDLWTGCTTRFASVYSEGEATKSEQCV